MASFTGVRTFRCVKLGIIHNPASKRNRPGGASPGEPELGVHAANRLGVLNAAPGTRDELRAALRDFEKAGVELVGIDGGDGTVREVLTTLPDAYGERLPKLAIMASGKTNVIGADVGHWGHGASAVERLVGRRRSKPLLTRSRATLDLSIDGEALSARGMVFGAAGFTRIIGVAGTKVHRRGFFQAPAVGLTVAAALLDTVVGKQRADWRRGTPIRLSVDHASLGGTAHFLFLATTLERFMLGIWPFWGSGGGPIHFLDVDAPPQRLMRATWCVLRGRQKPWMSERYRSGTAEEIALELHAPVILDGERFMPGESGIVRLSRGPTFEFLHP